MGDSIILPGDGASHTEVHFRYIVFRPSIGDVITGKIRSCSREGVHVTLGFFDDILIPPTAMQHPSRFEETEQAWVWEYPTDDGHHDLYMDIGEPVKFRVTGETFEESSPVGPPASDASTAPGGVQSVHHPQAGGPGAAGSAGAGDAVCDTTAKTPYRIVVAINESGLGLLSWWDQHSPAAEEDDGGDDEAGEEYEE